jgi:parallel beta-helix repeat protein
MDKKTASAIMLALLLTSMLTMAFNIQPVKAEGGTIYIRADGSVDPPKAPIQRDGDVYTFTGNIYDSIIVERDNIVIDGAGYTLQGIGAAYSTGIDLHGRKNVTIRSIQIKAFDFGILLYLSSNNSIVGNNLTANIRSGIELTGSSNNIIADNNLINDDIAIYLFESSNNMVVENNVTANKWYGIELYYSSKNIIVGNNIIANERWGIEVYISSDNIIAGNNVVANQWYGIFLYKASKNKFYHNNIIDNIQQVDNYTPNYANVWDDGYPSGGNYWSDYMGIDADGDEIGDTPYIIDTNNRDRYPLVNPWRWAPTPPPTPTPPVASFIYNPTNPIIGEEITFDASDSYDPDGGTITNYRWEFYRLTDQGAIILPPIEVIEGADKEVVSYSFGKGEYLVTLTVTDDEGQTSKTSKTVKVWEKWSFAIIADPQIGIGWLNGEDYGDPGWDDDESGDEYYVTDYLNKAVNLINRHIELGNEYNIAFVVVLGDLSDSAEMSEFNKGVEILSKLKVPWIPVMGNHDVWPHVSNEDEADEETPDWYFHDIFKTQYEYLSNIFQNWEKEPVPKQNPETGKWYYFQNFAFDYKGYHFVGLDFNSRDPPPLPWMPGVEAWAHLYDFEGGTWNWFKEHFDAYADKGNENTIIFSHHPMRWDPLPIAFSLSDMAKISWYINTNNFRDNIWGNFAGHTHKNREGYVEATGMYCIETVATFEDPHPRIVQVYVDGTIDYSTLLRDERKGMWMTAHSPVDLVVTDPDGLTISKELSEIQEAFYLEDDVNEDGLPDDFIVIPERKIGDYRITVLSEPDAEPIDTYTLEVSGEDATIVLAENVPIRDIPTQPYILRSTETDIIPIISATMDFDPDTLNLKSKGEWVTVYIELPLGHGYDVSMINLTSVMLNGQVYAETTPFEIGDYDSDGIPDLMVKFNRAAVQAILQVGDKVEITISGKLIDDRLFEGKDTIQVILPS